MNVERRLRWRNAAELAVAVPAFAGLMWALYEGLLAVLVVTADDFPQCPADRATRL